MMSSIRIIPSHKLLLTYDIRTADYLTYQRFVLDEFIPGLQELELYILGAWHTAYGDYPMRQIEFVMEDRAVMRRALQDDRWQQLETQLKRFTSHYERKLVHYRSGFQF